MTLNAFVLIRKHVAITVITPRSKKDGIPASIYYVSPFFFVLWKRIPRQRELAHSDVLDRNCSVACSLVGCRYLHASRLQRACLFSHEWYYALRAFVWIMSGVVDIWEMYFHSTKLAHSDCNKVAYLLCFLV